MKMRLILLLFVLAMLLTACGNDGMQTDGQTQPSDSAPFADNAETTQEDGAGATQSNESEEVTENTQVSQGNSVHTELPESDMLAALTIYGLSLEYFEFEMGGVYAAPQEADGIYVTFVSGGMDYVAHVYAIENERRQSGTVDLYAPEVGYAAFDLIDALPGGLTEIDAAQYTAAFERISMPSVNVH